MFDPETDTVQYERDGHVAVVTLDWPAQLNALTVAMRETVARCLVDADESVRAVVVPATGSTVRLPRDLAYCHAMEFLLTGDLFSADHAYRVGLINDVVPADEVFERATVIARRITSNSPDAVRAIKEIVQRGSQVPREEAFEIESAVGLAALGSDDVDEGRAAYEEGRTPEY